MFSLNQIYLLNSAKEEGKEWLVMAYDESMEQIRSKIEEMDLFVLFRAELFNQREPCVILEIDRKMTMRHPLMDPVDVHKILLENDGYEKLAEEMEDVKLSYKVTDDSEVIKLKMEFRPRPPMPPPIVRISTPLLPASDDEEESPIECRLSFAEKCCTENCENVGNWYNGPCTGCYLRNAADADSYVENEEDRLMWDKEFRRNTKYDEDWDAVRADLARDARKCVIPDCHNEGVNGGCCQECAERDEVYDQDDRNKASLRR
jgi:hypothetical protein